MSTVQERDMVIPPLSCMNARRPGKQAIRHLDKQLADLKPDDRKKQRQINLKPLAEDFFVRTKEIRFSGRLTKRVNRPPETAVMK